MYGPVIFQAKGGKVHPSPRDNSLVTRYGLPEQSCFIINKVSYMYDYTGTKVVKVVSQVLEK